MLRRIALCLVVSMAAGGCSFGPRALERSHGPYNEAVKECYEEQLLLNLVRLRYNDNPSRLDIASIAAQFELTASTTATPLLAAAGSNSSTLVQSFTRLLPAGTVQSANRPTVSFVPSDDRSTVQRFLTPVTGEGLFFIAESGWPIETVFRLYVNSLNGISNAEEACGPARDAVPEFAEFQCAAKLLQAVQDKGCAKIAAEESVTDVGGPVKTVTAEHVIAASKDGLEWERRGDGFMLVKKGQKLVVMVNPKTRNDPEVVDLIQMLNLKPGVDKYDVVVGGAKPYPEKDPPPQTTIHIMPRSGIQALFYLSRGVEVPAPHLGSLAKASMGPDGQIFDWPVVTSGIFAVHSCKSHRRPACAWIAVKYHDWWFYIDNRDHESKATFVLMQQLTRLDVTDKKLAGPLLTLPVGH